MTDDPRRELARLVGHVRREVVREIEGGHRLSPDPALRELLRRPAVGPPPAAPPAIRSAAPPSRRRASVPETVAPDAPATSTRQASVRPAEPARAAKALPPVGFPADDPRPLAEITRELAGLAAAAAECTRCGLCQTRTRVVYSAGSARQPLMFVGEAPGFSEDQEGLPFVGKAGKLLTDIITAMGFERGEIYIANVLKCRPPDNRDPLPHEVEACWPWLERQIELVQPRVICTVGRHSAQLLTGRTKDTIGNLRGKVHHYKGIPVVPTYHPAFLLRSPSYKRVTWEDVQLVRDIYLAGTMPGEPAASGKPAE